MFLRNWRCGPFDVFLIYLASEDARAEFVGVSTNSLRTLQKYEKRKEHKVEINQRESLILVKKLTKL